MMRCYRDYRATREARSIAICCTVNNLDLDRIRGQARVSAFSINSDDRRLIPLYKCKSKLATRRERKTELIEDERMVEPTSREIARDATVSFRPFSSLISGNAPLLLLAGDNVDCWMEIQHGKGPWAPPVSGIVPLGSTLTLVVAINDYRGNALPRYTEASRMNPDQRELYVIFS